MIYLDTCILIYAVEDAGPRGDRIRAGIAERDANGFAVSGLTKMECLVGAYRRQDDLVQARYDQVFARVSSVPMTEETFLRAARLRADHNLKVSDALHLAAALGAGCSELWTNDYRLARAAGPFAVVVAGT